MNAQEILWKKPHMIYPPHDCPLRNLPQRTLVWSLLSVMVWKQDLGPGLRKFIAATQPTVDSHMRKKRGRQSPKPALNMLKLGTEYSQVS